MESLLFSIDIWRNALPFVVFSFIEQSRRRRAVAICLCSPLDSWRRTDSCLRRSDLSWQVLPVPPLPWAALVMQEVYLEVGTEEIGSLACLTLTR